MSKTFWAIIGVILIIFIAYYIYMKGYVKQSNTETQAPTAQTTQKTNSSVMSFEVVGTKFAYSPNEIRVKKGDTVKITFKDNDGFHDLVVDGYNVKTERISTGQSSNIEFVADKAGTFDYYCSVDGHRGLGMNGKLIVE